MSGLQAMVTTFKRQQTIVFKVRIVDHMQIKDGGSHKNTTRVDPRGFSVWITARCGISL